jgi:mRNA-degrading endonuclease toxin of MazEF toxin-antitoxin module
VVRQGELYWANLPEAPRHPVVILARESLNRGCEVLAPMLTSSRFEERRQLPASVPILAGTCGLAKNCVVPAQAVFAIRLSNLDLADGPNGRLDSERMRDVIRAIGHVLDADCEPA